MVNMNICRCDGGKRGEKCKNKIVQASDKFFRIGIKKIENACNNKRKILIEKWQEKNPNAKMNEYSLSISYSEGLKEIYPIFDLSEPEEISIFIIEGEKSKCNNGQAAMEIRPLDLNFKKWQLNAYLDVMDYLNDILEWRGFRESIEDITYHELLHACGDHPWNNRHDGILRHNLIGISCIKEI